MGIEESPRERVKKEKERERAGDNNKYIRCECRNQNPCSLSGKCSLPTKVPPLSIAVLHGPWLDSLVPGRRICETSQSFSSRIADIGRKLSIQKWKGNNLTRSNKP